MPVVIYQRRGCGWAGTVAAVTRWRITLFASGVDAPLMFEVGEVRSVRFVLAHSREARCEMADRQRRRECGVP